MGEKTCLSGWCAPVGSHLCRPCPVVGIWAWHVDLGIDRAGKDHPHQNCVHSWRGNLGPSRHTTVWASLTVLTRISKLEGGVVDTTEANDQGKGGDVERRRTEPWECTYSGSTHSPGQSMQGVGSRGPKIVLRT